MAGNAAHWRDLPDTFGKWTAVHARFRRWSRNGVWEGLFHAMADTPDFDYVMIDSTISKVHADASGAKGGLKGSEEHTSERQSLMRISYTVFCLKQKISETKTHLANVDTDNTTAYTPE